MGNVKNWLMEMEDNACGMTREEFIKEHGISHVDVWDKFNDPESIEKNERAEEQEALAEIAAEMEMSGR